MNGRLKPRRDYSYFQLCASTSKALNLGTCVHTGGKPAVYTVKVKLKLPMMDNQRGYDFTSKMYRNFHGGL